MNARRKHLPAVVVACLSACVFTLAGAASAQECSGSDVTELVAGCSVLVANEDFLLRLYAPEGADLGSGEGVREALQRAVVFLHGYGVVDPALPAVLYEDGSPGLFADLHAAGISVVAMAPGSSKTDRVEQDADAARDALVLLNGYRGDAALPWVVFAHSMGSLLARIALARMEADGAAHNVALYISYDAPHRGVHVPHGMQSLKIKLDEWAAMTEADFVAIDPGWEGVFNLASIVGMTTTLDPDAVQGFPDPTSTQAQQMTIQGIAAPEEYPLLMTLLDETGFPAVRSIAVSNGNTQGIANSQEVPPGGELFYFTGAKGNSAASVRGTFEVFTDSPEAHSFKSHVYYDGTFQNHDGGNKNASAPLDIVLMDSLSGGTLDYASEMLAAAVAAEDDFHEPSFRAAANSAIPFVPTSSALGLPIGTLDAELAGIVAAGGTPFDDVIAMGDLDELASNLDHNTLVLTDALLAEIHALLPCREGIDRIGCVVEEPGTDAGVSEPDECAGFALPPDAGCDFSVPDEVDDEDRRGCNCRAAGGWDASGFWLAVLSGIAAFRRRGR